MPIQWFPGHMTRTKKLILSHLSKVDMITEVLDARAPLASRNPLLEELIREKPRLVILNKVDLADPSLTRKWLDILRRGERCAALGVNSKQKGSLKGLVSACRELCRDKKWIKRRPVRTMIAGIPNVGKSTIINTLSGKKKAAAANKPGVTRDMQRVPVSPQLQILDTPGILWHKFDDPLTGLKLASLGAIRDAVLPVEEVALRSIAFLAASYPEGLLKRFKFEEDAETLKRLPLHDVLEACGRSRGLLQTGAAVDRDKAARLLLKELRNGLLGRITLEYPGDPNRNWLFNKKATREEL